MKYTKEKWFYDTLDGHFSIGYYKDNGESETMFTIDTIEANAQRIVTCVNSHDDLLAALEMCINQMEKGVIYLTKGDKRKAQQAINKATSSVK